MLNLRKKLPHQDQDQGFTLVEVLVAILITTVFVAVAMQAVVIAAVFKARAKQFSEATNWIQEDVESVRQQATIVGYTTLSAAPTTTSLSLSSTAGFSAGNQVQIGTISGTVYTISSPSGSTFTVTPALTATQISATPVGTPVSVVIGSTNTTLCYASASTNGFGSLLRGNLPAVPSETSNSSNPNSGTKTITGGTYTLTRIATPKSAAPFEVLEITYSVAQSTKPPVAILNTEVIPNAAFQCPPF